MIQFTFQTPLLGFVEHMKVQTAHFFVPMEQVPIWKEAGVKRVNGTLNGKPFRLAFNSDKQGGYYLIMSKTLCKQANVAIGDRVTIHLEQDMNPDFIDFPEELLEVLAQDEEANTKFFALTPGKQRSLHYYVIGVKNVETRIQRSFEICEQVKSGRITIGTKEHYEKK